MSDWQIHTAGGDTFWTLEYLGQFAKVWRFGQAWMGRIAPANDDDATYIDYFTSPSVAMASMVLAIEAYVQVRSA